MPDSDHPGRRLLESLGRPFPAEELFDVVPDIVFFVKDREGRYVSVNRTLADRCGLAERSQAIGRTALELVPPPARRSLRPTGPRDHQNRARHPRPARTPPLPARPPRLVPDLQGTARRPLRPDHRPVRDLARPPQPVRGPRRPRPRCPSVLDHVHRHIDEPLRLGQLAEMAGLSPYQLDQRIRSLFQLSVRQFLIKVRIDSACEHLARADHPIARVALDCGYSDQSAFSRQFRQVVGISPLAYRKRSRSI